MTGVGWRWTFLLPVPIALAALVAAFVLLPKDEPAEDGGHDLLGARDLHGGDAAARLHRRHRARGRLGLGPHDRLVRPGRRAGRRVRARRDAGSRTR